MSITLLEFVFVSLVFLVPNRPAFQHVPLAVAITQAVEENDPLFKDDGPTTVDGVELPAKAKTAALMAAISYKESTARPRASGDCRGLPAGSPACTPEKARSFGAFQQWIEPGARSRSGLKGIDLLERADLQAKDAIAMLHESFHACREYPVAWYAHGNNAREACEDKRSQMISNDRLWRAREARKGVVQLLRSATDLRAAYTSTPQSP